MSALETSDRPTELKHLNVPPIFDKNHKPTNDNPAPPNNVAEELGNLSRKVNQLEKRLKTNRVGGIISGIFIVAASSLTTITLQKHSAQIEHTAKDTVTQIYDSLARTGIAIEQNIRNLKWEFGSFEAKAATLEATATKAPAEPAKRKDKARDFNDPNASFAERREELTQKISDLWLNTFTSEEGDDEDEKEDEERHSAPAEPN